MLLRSLSGLSDSPMTVPSRAITVTRRPRLLREIVAEPIDVGEGRGPRPEFRTRTRRA